MSTGDYLLSSIVYKANLNLQRKMLKGIIYITEHQSLWEDIHEG